MLTAKSLFKLDIKNLLNKKVQNRNTSNSKINIPIISNLLIDKISPIKKSEYLDIPLLKVKINTPRDNPADEKTLITVSADDFDFSIK